MNTPQCPNCKGYKTRKAMVTNYFLGLKLFFLSIPLLFILVGFITMPVAILLMAFSPFIERKVWHCKNCNFKFKIEK